MSGIDGREHDREGPLPALRQRAGGFAGEEQRVDLDVARVAGAPVEAREQRALAARVKDVGIAWDPARCSRSRRRPRCKVESPPRPPRPRGGARHADGASCPAARRRRDTGCRSWWPRDRAARWDSPGRSRSGRRSCETLAPPSLLSTMRSGIGRVDPQVVIVAVRRAERCERSCRRRWICRSRC